MESITRFQIKNTEEKYKLKDSEAIREIKYGNSSSGWVTVSPTEGDNGKITLEIPKYNLANSTTPGLVLVSNEKNKTNIAIENGYLKAIVPIISVSDSEKKVFDYDSETERTVIIPKATASSFGLVKVGGSQSDTIIMNQGKLETSFGKGNNKFYNIYVEEIDIQFSDYEDLFKEVE